jgi:hypothetical protein
LIARATILLALAVLPACGQSLATGAFEGDATVQLQGTAGVPVGAAVNPTVGALWLGYSAASDPANGLETTTLPVTAVHFPPSFTFDFLGPPPSTGDYATADERIIPSAIRIAALILFDDVDADGQVAVDGAGLIVAPDRLLARADGQMVLFVESPPADPSALDGADTLITNWEAATPGYHLLALDTSVTPPDFSGRVVSTQMPVVFVPSSTAVP